MATGRSRTEIPTAMPDHRDVADGLGVIGEMPVQAPVQTVMADISIVAPNFTWKLRFQPDEELCTV